MLSVFLYYLLHLFLVLQVCSEIFLKNIQKWLKKCIGTNIKIFPSVIITELNVSPLIKQGSKRIYFY